MAQEKSSFNSRGFSLIEVVVAMGLLTMVSLGVAQLFAASTRVNIIARGQTSTTMLAEQKLEQIRSLTWGFDSNGEGLPVSDTTSDLTAYPSTQNGSGLNPSPADSLEHNSTVSSISSMRVAPGSGQATRRPGQPSTSADGRFSHCRRTRTTRS